VYICVCSRAGGPHVLQWYNADETTLLTYIQLGLCRVYVCLAVRAAHTFCSGTTLMKVTAVDRFGAPVTRKVKTKMLCQTTDPEEKRTIIGDTFMNVTYPSPFFLTFIHRVYHASWKVLAKYP